MLFHKHYFDRYLNSAQEVPTYDHEGRWVGEHIKWLYQCNCGAMEWLAKDPQVCTCTKCPQHSV